MRRVPTDSRRTLLIATLAVVAVGLFASSFFVPAGNLPLVSTSHDGPFSTTSAVARHELRSQVLEREQSRSFALSFQFRPTSLVAGTRLFQIGDGRASLQVLVDPLGGTSGALLLTSSEHGRATLQVVLLDSVQVHRAYDIHLALSPGGAISGSVNGQRQFLYAHAPVTTHLSLLSVGGGAGGDSVKGTVSDFRISTRTYGAVSSATFRALLRIAAGLLAALLIALLLTTFAVADWRWDDIRGLQSCPRARRVPGQRAVVVLSVTLLAGGVAALALLTPSNNTDAVQTGFQRFTSLPVPQGTWTGSDFGKEAELLKSASSVNVHLSLEMKVPSLPIPSPGFFGVVLAAARYNQGLEIDVTRQGVLSALIGEHYFSIPLYVRLSNRIPTARWFRIDADIDQGQSLRMTVDNQQVQAFSYARPVLNPAPTGLSVGGGPPGTFGGSLKDIVMTTTLFGSSRPPDDPGRRLGQFLGFLAIVLAILLLCRRFLSGLFATSTHERRPLIRAVFGTTAILIAVNFLVDLLQLQPDLGPTTSRNSWLFAPYVQFSDFFQVLSILKSFNPYGFQAGSYPPAGYLLLSPLSWMSEYSGVFVFLAVFVGFLTWWAIRIFGTGLHAVEKAVLMVVIFASLPVSIGIDRGNVDLWVFILFAIGIALLEHRKQAAAASCLALIGAAKVAPTIYLLEFIRRRSWRQLVIGVAVGGSVTIAGFLAFKGSFIGNIDGFGHALSAVEHTYNGTQNGTYFNCSIYGWAQAIGYAVDGLHGSLLVRSAIEPFVLPGEVAGLVLLVWHLRAKETSLWRSLTLMTLWFLLLQDVAYYYELLFLLVPLSLFVRDAPLTTRSMRIACLFGLILAPKAYFDLGHGSVDSGVLFTAPLLVVLAYEVIRQGKMERRVRGDGGADETEDQAVAVHSHVTAARGRVGT
jgi:hypothetical protein